MSFRSFRYYVKKYNNSADENGQRRREKAGLTFSETVSAGANRPD